MTELDIVSFIPGKNVRHVVLVYEDDLDLLRLENKHLRAILAHIEITAEHAVCPECKCYVSHHADACALNRVLHPDWIEEDKKED